MNWNGFSSAERFEMKDRAQKASALRYALARRWIPQLELNVANRIALCDARVLITDVDVFVALPDDVDGFAGLVIDCKAGKHDSPISRALWTKGVMERLEVRRGMCILNRESIEYDHRHTAARLGVVLLSEKEFPLYARSTTDAAVESTPPALADIDRWDAFFSIHSRFPKPEKAIRFSKSDYWMIDSDGERCRRVIATIRDIAPELDPAKREHHAVFADLSSLIALALCRLISRMFVWTLQPNDRSELAALLLPYLYGGREPYEYRNRLFKQVVSMKKGTKDEREIEDLTLPAWETFVQLCRHVLEAPFAIHATALFLRSSLGIPRDRIVSLRQ
jgi:hypothetical protein